MNDRCPVWPWITTALLGLPVLYILSFGPACWICERLGKGTGHVSAVYRPVIWLGNRLPLRTDVMSQYARLGARPGATPDFTSDELAWWETVDSETIYWTTAEPDIGTISDDSTP